MSSESKKRILVFSIAYYPFVGGAEVALREITKRLENYDFTLITLRMDKNLPKKETEGNVTIYRIGFPSNTALKISINWPILLSKYFFPFLALFKALRLNRGKKFDISWSIMANYAGFAALFFKMLKPKIPFLLTLQEGDPPEHIRKKVGPFMPLYKMIFSKADRVQAISKFLANYAKEMGYKKEATVIPNGVFVELFSKDLTEEEIKKAKEVLDKKDGDLILITSSRLVKKNAVDDIIKSLSFLPQNFKLFIAGRGEEEDNLRSLTKDLSLEGRVKFGGFIPHKELAPLVKASDIFIRPSRSEGLGNSFLEAMAGGIPVIATPVGGIPDFLENEKTGLFCKVDNPEDIAKQVKRLIEDNKLTKTIIENAKNLVLKKYDWDVIAKRMKEEVFNAIL